jgi:hypothetical protein
MVEAMRKTSCTDWAAVHLAFTAIACAQENSLVAALLEESKSIECNFRGTT